MQHWPRKISLLFVIAMNNMNEEKIKSTYQKDLPLNNIDDVDFASKSKEEIITKITYSLKKKNDYFFRTST